MPLFVQPAIAILHTLYGIYRLSRSPVGRPPTLQANYMLFASTFDIGLIPFYVVTAYVTYAEFAKGAYNWRTMLGDNLIAHQIATTTFLLSAVNGALHLVSFGISLSLMVAFRRIARLPPDMNPLEDNLTARPHKRSKSELTEKHMSQSTLDSGIGMNDPLIGAPRNVPLPTHYRGDSYDNGFSQFPSFPDHMGHQPMAQQPQGRFVHPDRLPYAPDQLPSMNIPRTQEVDFQQKADEKRNSIPRKPVQTINGNEQKPTPPVHLEVPRRAPSSAKAPSRTESVSTVSGNWVAYPSRSPSPLDNILKEDTLNENEDRRDTSSTYSRSNTTASTSTVAKDWPVTPQRSGWDIGETIAEDVRGEYESIALNEYYGHDDAADYYPKQNGIYGNTEQDLGDHHINIYTDNQYSDDDENNNDDDYEDAEVDMDQGASLPLNPLGLNPPTPQTSNVNLHDTPASANSRMALADIPNLSPDMRARSPTPGDSPMKKTGRTYGDLGRKISNNIRNVSGPRKMSSKKNKTAKQNKSQKANSYGALRQDDDVSDNDGNESDGVPSADVDRKGRVVSNSGADVAAGGTPRANNAGSASAGLASYGSYIAGLGVGIGRRRDVSGKMAEEGRSGTMVNAGRPGTEPEHKNPIRAPGWARFAGL